MKTAYWIAAALLAVVYLYSGGQKLVRSKDQLRPMMAWVDAMPLWLVRFIGAVEVAGAAGLILPPLTGIAPFLAFLAAAGLAVLQILAAGLHVSRGEVKDTWLNAVLAAVAAATAWLATAW